jgi:hypothetical protein
LFEGKCQLFGRQWRLLNRQRRLLGRQCPLLNGQRKLLNCKWRLFECRRASRNFSQNTFPRHQLYFSFRARSIALERGFSR